MPLALAQGELAEAFALLQLRENLGALDVVARLDETLVQRIEAAVA